MSIINLDQAIALLQEGQVVGIPTETVYGLAARIDNESALTQVFAIKQRPFFDPLIVHVIDVNHAKALTSYWPSVYDILADQFWPGPLTLIASKHKNVSPLITSGLETVALRCPQHSGALQILNALKIPLAAPSANKFGRTSPTQAQHVEAEFNGKIPVVDGGSCVVGLESTVLQAFEMENHHWRIQIYRPGAIGREQISQILTANGVNHVIERTSSASSPGNIKEHYQPSRPIVLINAREFPTSQITDTWIQKKIPVSLQTSNFKIARLNLHQQPEMAARFLYQQFRDLSLPDFVIVVVKTPEQSGFAWEAVWDRIERAATYRVE